MADAVEITQLRKAGGALTKTFHLKPDGSIGNDSRDCRMARGSASRLILKDPRALAAELSAMPVNGALALGRLRAGLPDEITIVAEKALDRNPGAYPRTAETFCYLQGQPGYVLCDFDRKGMPAPVCARIEALGGFVAALESLCPAIGAAASVLRPSTSFGVYDPSTGRAHNGGGSHFYAAIADSSDAERFLKVLHRQAWLAGLGWYLISKSGAFLERSIIDVSVANAERIVFEADPILRDGLAQEPRRPAVREGAVLDSRAACPDLLPHENDAFKKMLAAERARLAPENARVKKSFVDEKIAEAVARGVPQDAAKRLGEQWANGVLYADAMLLFDDLGPVTAGEVLADPGAFQNETLADPIEGPEYGANIAIVYRRRDGTPWIYSWAHGGTKYELKHDPAAEGPLPLFPEIPPPAPFPLEALGPVLSSAARAIANKVQVPAAMAAQSVLSVASLAACAHADVRLPFGQVRPLGLYFMTVATSGDRKSTSDLEALWAVHKQERILAARREEELKIWRIAHASWAGEKKKIESNRSLDFAERKACLAALGEEPLRPLEALLVTGDLTVEGLTKNWPGMHAALGIFTAEGGTFTGGYGMSEENRLKTASALSEAWDGRPVKRARAQDGILMLLGRRLAMHLMINREAAAAFLGDSVLRDQGLFARILLAYPETIAGSRLYREPDPADEAAIRCFGARMLSLLEEAPALAPGQRNELAPPPLLLTAGAARLWIAFHDHVERQCGEEGELAPIKDVAAKVAEQAARIAGVLTISADRDAREIGEDVMQGAVALADWYLAEASRTQLGVTVDPKLARAARLLDWLKAQPGATAGFRKILNQGPNATRIKAAAEDAIEILIAHGAATEASARPRMFRAVGNG